MRTLADVSYSPEHGLSQEAVGASRQKFGANSLTPLPREPIWMKFIEKFDDPIIKILLAAALLSMFVELFQFAPRNAGLALGVFLAALVGLFVARLSQWVPSLMFGSAIAVFVFGLIIVPAHPLIEGLAVMIAVMLATGVAFAAEFKSDREFEALNAQKDSIRVKVTRDGHFQTIPLEEVVVGDIVDLETGDEIPADGRLLKSAELMVDQSLMTGESEPVKKAAHPNDSAEGPDQPGCVYRGTQVVDGAAIMVVTEVGDATMIGQIAKRLGDGGDEEDEAEDGKPETEETRVKKKLTISKALTPLQVKLTDLADLISKVGYAAAVLIFIALLVRGFFMGELNPETIKEIDGVEQAIGWLGVVQYVLSYFVYMVIIIVVAVPEGLPMSVTVSLALAMQKMTRANSLVRQLVACETIGSATVICSDKTGTLTQNKMQVVRLFLGGTAYDRGQPGFAPPPVEHPLTLNAALNSTANLEEKNGKIFTVGNSTEGALLQLLGEAKHDYVRLRAAHPPVHSIHFSSERKRMTTVVEHGGKLIALMKGAPEIVMEHTTHYLNAEGKVVPWDSAARDAANAFVRESARQAMRTLAFAARDLDGFPTNDEALAARRDEIESQLVFTGLVAIRDPLRDDVKEAVDRCRAAGIEVKMITGDNVETARAIAFNIGVVDSLEAPIDTDGARVFTSSKFNADFDRLKSLPADSAEATAIRERLSHLRVLARARPLDKYKMVELLQGRNEVVAMTGDGTNDAPSLKKADVGLAMGIAGTEVAKEASKIVLLDDAFSTIVSAVKWGRALYENIQRFIQFQLTINVSALTIAFLGPFLGIRPPFTVLQLLWINVIMDTFASIALCSEPPREEVMKLPPKKKDENILSRAMVQTILSTAVFFVVVMIGLLLGMQHLGWFKGDGPPSAEFAPLTTRQVSIFFGVYVFFQVWNLINSRSLDPRVSGFTNLLGNTTFLMIAAAIAVGQIVLTSIPWVAAVFKVEPLAWTDWLGIVAFTSTVLVFAEVRRLLRVQSA